MERFIVMSAAASMPNSCWGRYGRVAVVELAPAWAEAGDRPLRISERTKGVARIVATWERQHIGRTPRGAFQRAMVEAQEMAERLNRNK
jgi:hypothetical protein